MHTTVNQLVPFLFAQPIAKQRTKAGGACVPPTMDCASMMQVTNEDHLSVLEYQREGKDLHHFIYFSSSMAGLQGAASAR